MRLISSVLFALVLCLAGASAASAQQHPEHWVSANLPDGAGYDQPTVTYFTDLEKHKCKNLFLLSEQDECEAGVKALEKAWHAFTQDVENTALSERSEYARRLWTLYDMGIEIESLSWMGRRQQRQQ